MSHTMPPTTRPSSERLTRVAVCRPSHRPMISVPGEAIVNQGDRSNALYFISSGTVSVTSVNDEGELVEDADQHPNARVRFPDTDR